MGLPGGSTIGAAEEPGAGRMVITGRPSGPTVTTARGEVVASGMAAPLTVIVPGNGLPGMSCGPEDELLLPPRMSPSAFEEDGDASSARPPKAVASTTPLTASRT